MKHSRIRGSAYNIYLSLLYLQDSLKNLDSDVFVPDFKDSKIDFCDLGMLWIVKDSKLINFHIQDNVLSFISNNKKRYSIVFLGLVEYCDDSKNFTNGHCNMLIFDNRDYSIYKIDSSVFALNKVFLIGLLNTYIKNRFLMYTLKIFDIPIQTIQEQENKMSIGDPRGFCLSWSILCTEYTIKNKEYIYKNLTSLIRYYSNSVLKIGERLRSKIVNDMYYN